MAKKGKINDFETVNDIIRPERIKKYQYVFLIVCEDQKTEKVYFERFKDHIPKETIFLETVGTGFDPLGVVTLAISKKKSLSELYKKEVDVVWLVFDKDDADENQSKIDRFQKALDTADEENFKLAFSNEVFELWLLLHLTAVDPDVPLSRAEIYNSLESTIRDFPANENFKYIHGSVEILNKIIEFGDEKIATKRAEILIKHHADKHLILSNPVTFVGRLIKDLNSWIAYYSYN